MSTPIVAMDMKAIVEELLRINTKPLSEYQKHIHSSKVESVGKVQYWGFSYGTLLDQTFAAMYPNLVGRMVLDGVVDADRRYAGTWDGNLADAIVIKFSEHCFEAGPENCALYTRQGSQHIQNTVDDIITSLANAPIPVNISDSYGPELITEGDVNGAVRDALYSPFGSFERLAKLLYDISQRNGILLADSKSIKYRWPGLTERCRSEGPYSSYCFSPHVDYAEEVVAAIACSDGPDQTNMTAAEFLEYWHRVKQESVYLGDRWAQYRLICVFWKLGLGATYIGHIGSR